MVFVWGDPETSNLGQLIPLPTFPALEKAIELKGPSSCYMRDLPYGYELLGENLLDLSHLPFSHHSVGNLNRDLGGPLPFKMLSNEQKSPDNPLYEATLEDAYKTDPLFSGNPKTPKDATLNLGFYEPCHVRYTRKAAAESYVAIFFCPTSATRSRVFLFNLSGVSPNPDDNDSKINTKLSKVKRMKNWVKPSSIKAKIQKKIISLMFTPLFSHQITHKIFDGDGIFLRMQGDRMQKEGLSYNDYRTPAAADVMVNSFRRYAKIATELTRKAGKESIAEAACSTKGYGSNLSRKDMLDRYESHTKNCKVCSDALKAKEMKKEQIQVAKTIIATGGIGASATSLLAILLLVPSEVSVPTAVVRATGKIFLGTIIASFGLSKLDKKNDEKIQQFLFEDYVHADKN
jgi:pheophorbide a oxygenase